MRINESFFKKQKHFFFKRQHAMKKISCTFAIFFFPLIKTAVTLTLFHVLKYYSGNEKNINKNTNKYQNFYYVYTSGDNRAQKMKRILFILLKQCFLYLNIINLECIKIVLKSKLPSF